MSDGDLDWELLRPGRTAPPGALPPPRAQLPREGLPSVGAREDQPSAGAIVADTGGAVSIAGGKVSVKRSSFCLGAEEDVCGTKDDLASKLCRGAMNTGCLLVGILLLIALFAIVALPLTKD